MALFSTILFPTDFSEHSQFAREHAVSLCRECGARLMVLHVIEEPIYPIDVTPFGFSPVELARDCRDRVAKQMAQLIEEIGNEGIEVESLIVDGKPFVQIIGVAREKGADLIVIGTHGRSGLSHVLLGSVTEKVVRKAPCPVLIVRKPGHQFVPP